MNNKKNFYCVSSRVENTGQLYGCFKIGPFFGHQGLTFANVLRRTLLADQSRATFNAIQIYGVEHEFSSLIGVREPVVDILLNLEKLIFQTLRPITKPQVASVHFCGPGILRAQHLHLPMSLKCVIPSQYIATVEVDGQLAFKLFFSPNLNKFQPIIQNIKLSHYKKRKTNSIFGFKKPVFVKKLQKSIKKKRKNGRLRLVWQPGLLDQKVTLPGRPSGSSSQRDGCDGGAADQQRDGPEGGAAPQGHGSAAIPPRERSKGDLAGRSFWKCGNPMQPSRSVPFTEQIQENFLFLKSSSCAIHKVNYTVQSHTTTYLDISNRKLNKSNSHEKFNYGLKLSGPKSLENNIESKEVSFLSRLSPKEKKKESSKKEEFLLFEIWTDGSLHPQTAILKAINELLLEVFPYSLQISKYEKIHTKYLNFQQIKRKEITDLSKKHFREKFLNLEVGNFNFDLETYLFLKKKKIYRVIDFLNFFSKKETLKTKIKITLDKFYVFILSLIKQ